MGDTTFKSSKGVFCIRHACESDIHAWVSLESISWPSPLKGLCECDVRQRVETFKQGQLVVVCEDSGRLVACLSTQRIYSIEKLCAGSVNFLTAFGLHVETGPVWQWLSLLVDPEFASSGVGDELFKYAFMVALILPGVLEVAAVTRCRSWGQARAYSPNLSINEYLASGSDAGIRWHKDRGAQVVAAVAEWRAEDKENLSFGVIVRYELNRLPCHSESHDAITFPPKEVNGDRATLTIEQSVQCFQPNVVTNGSVDVKPLLLRWGANAVALTKKSARVQGKGKGELKKGVQGVLEQRNAKSVGNKGKGDLEIVSVRL